MITNRMYKRVMAAAVVVMGLSMGACVDNIDNSTTPSDNQEQQAEAAKQARAEKFWDIVSHLVDIDEYTDDYEDKTFEPVYGVEGSEAGTRYVYTNDAATAAARFADLVEREGIDETTEQYTYDDPDVGKFVYTKGTGRILATVDVDIKQIPSLKKIVYVPGAYANATFNYKAYYRFGDVVFRIVKNYEGKDIPEFWICVRPAFGPEGKSESHWVSLGELPKANVWYHQASNGNNYYLPTKLGTNKEHMQNLAEMLYAIFCPEEWEENIREFANNYFNLKMFNDFDPKNVKYHNQYFWKNVQEQWKAFNILNAVFNYDEGEQFFTNYIVKGHLELLYKGYSWNTWLSWNCKLFNATYYSDNSNVNRNYEGLNMHSVDFEEITRNMQECPVDFRKTGQVDSGKYLNFFGEDEEYRWTVRHATGKELVTGGRYRVDQPIPGVYELYRYYNYYDLDNPQNQPEETTEQ